MCEITAPHTSNTAYFSSQSTRMFPQSTLSANVCKGSSEVFHIFTTRWQQCPFVQPLLSIVKVANTTCSTCVAVGIYNSELKIAIFLGRLLVTAMTKNKKIKKT